KPPCDAQFRAPAIRSEGSVGRNSAKSSHPEVCNLVAAVRERDQAVKVTNRVTLPSRSFGRSKSFGERFAKRHKHVTSFAPVGSRTAGIESDLWQDLLTDDIVQCFVGLYPGQLRGSKVSQR